VRYLVKILGDHRHIGSAATSRDSSPGRATCSGLGRIHKLRDALMTEFTDAGMVADINGEQRQALSRRPLGTAVDMGRATRRIAAVLVALAWRADDARAWTTHEHRVLADSALGAVLVNLGPGDSVRVRQALARAKPGTGRSPLDTLGFGAISARSARNERSPRATTGAIAVCSRNWPQ